MSTSAICAGNSVRFPMARNASKPSAERDISTSFQINRKADKPPLRSLFAKIFLWFWLAMALVSLTLILSSVWTESRASREHDEAIDRAMTPLLADNFAEVYDRDGKGGLEDLLARGEGSFPWKPFLFDLVGHEVLGRSVSPQAIEAMQLVLASKRTEVVHGGDARWVGQYVQATNGHPYVLVLEIDRRMPDPAFVVPSHVQLLRFVIVLLIVGLICLWITRHITSPLFQLRSAANQLAQG